MTYGVGNPGPDLVQAQQCGRVKIVYGILTFLLDTTYWIYNGDTDIKKTIINLQITFHSKD